MTITSATFSLWIIFYDCETYVDEKHTHVPFLVCTVALDLSEKFEAYGLDCTDWFVKYFRGDRYRGPTLIMHNARGFRSYLALWHVVNLVLTPSLIMQGSKVRWPRGAKHIYK